MTEETALKLAEYRRLKSVLDEFEDDPVGPWYLDDGRPWAEVAGLKISTAGPHLVPAHHPRRCHGVSRRGHRCKVWALTGRRLCRFHGGTSLLGHNSGGRVSVRYKQYLEPNLARRLDQFLGSKSHKEQLELYEEIALARVCLAEQLRIASLALGSEGVTAETKLLAMNCVQEQMSRVADLCSKMASIEKNMADQVSIRQLGLFVRRISQIVYKQLGDCPQADAIAQALETDLELPSHPGCDSVIKLEFET